jgi:DNA repair protein RecO (recombination protein O)
MPIYEDEAIVLRQYPLADSDSIVVCATPGLGKIRTVARGIKKPGNRLAGCLEPLNHIRVAFFAREGLDLGRIRNAELIHSYSGKIKSVHHLFAFSYFSELVHVLIQENQANPTLFRLLLASLRAGERYVPVAPLARYFEVWCLKISGLYPNYAYCSGCGKYVKELGFFAHVKDGQAFCGDCAGNRGTFIGSAASRALEAIVKLPPEEFAVIPLEAEAGLQLERLTQDLLGQNLDGPLKSYRILKSALQEIAD